MLNIDKIEKVYLDCGYTDLRKSIDGLVMMVKNQFKLDPFEKALFVFCNKQMDKLKILHFDEGFWLYYHRLESNRFKCQQQLKNEIAFLKGIISNKNRKIFGASS